MQKETHPADEQKERSENFVLNLKRAYPNLTSADIEFCLMLKKGMDTAEIARISNLSKSTIRSRKARLKKKMKLSDSAIKIDKFLSDFD